MSRLEEIKAKPYFNKETRTDRVNSADIVWLIKRVEELEERNGRMRDSLNLLDYTIREVARHSEMKDKVIERYKQTLELIHKDTYYESEHDLISPIHVIRKRAEKALEESE